MKRIRKRLTYANVMSSIAVFLVIGGATAFAALGKNTVGTKQLKKNAVNSSKVKNGSLTGADIKLSSLGAVPSATNANHASSADNAAHATTADTATTANSAFSTYHDGAIVMPDTLTAVGNPIATLSIPNAGNYVINAKLEAYDASGTTDLSTGECTLTAEGDIDTQFFDATASVSDDQESVALQLVHRFGGAGAVTLRCTDFGNGIGDAYYTKITAQQVANLTNTGF